MKHVYINNLKIKKKINFETTLEYEILSKKGLYKIKNEKIFLFKLAKNETEIIQQDGITFFVTDNYWFKIKDNVDILPFDINMIKIKVNKYKINDNLNLVVEENPIQKKTFFEIKNIKNAIADIISFL
jgi:hypothetical protein